MGNIFIYSIIIGIISALILVPFKNNEKLRIHMKGKTKLLIFVSLAALITIGAFLFYYFTLLDQTISSLWIFVIILTLLGSMLATGMERTIKGILFAGSLLVGLYFLTAFLFNADEKYTIAKMDIKEEIQTFDENKKPASVPPQYARNKMKKAFGHVPNTSYYELGNLQIQKVNDEYVYIAPVEFSGFFKWLKGKETPGYFILSATDSSANPKFVDAEMIYTPSAYFNKETERRIRLQFPSYIFYGDSQLEIDDNGTPFYIRSYGDFVSARNGFKVKGVVVMDAKTGKSNSYSLSEAPEFIDGAVAPEVVSTQNSYFGNYIHGYWNSLFGKSDVKLPSDEGTEANVSPIFDENGDMYYFTDFTSPKEGVDSMLGYALTNSRTGKAVYYTGNMEESYMDSQGALQIIEKKFIEKKWEGKMPIIYNFYGEASWLTGVLDSNGFLQNYFIVSAANPEITAYGSTPNEALKLYKTALQKGGGTVNGTSTSVEKKIDGKVIRVYKEKSGEYTVVSFLLDNGQSYNMSSEKDPLIIYLQENDQVSVTYLDTGENFLPVNGITIKNLQ